VKETIENEQNNEIQESEKVENTDSEQDNSAPNTEKNVFIQKNSESVENVEKNDSEESVNNEEKQNNNNKKVFIEKKSENVEENNNEPEVEETNQNANTDENTEVKNENVIEKKENKKIFVQKNIIALTNTTAAATPPLPPSPYPENTRIEKNLYLSMNDKEGLARNKNCTERTGLLYTIRDSKQRDLKDPRKNILSHVITPAYIVLNINSFSVMSKQSSESVIRALIVEKIDKIKQSYKNTACFDLFEEGKTDKPLSLCASSKKEMDEWIVSVLEFKECILKEKAYVVDANKNAFKKPEKVNNGPKKNPLPHKSGPLAQNKIVNGTKIVQQPGNTENPKAESRDPYYYTNEHKKDAETVEVEESDETLTRMLNAQKRLELAQRQIKRQVEDKIRKVKEAHLKLIQKNKLLAKRNYLHKKKELAATTKKIEDMAKKQESQILNDAMKQMQNMDVILIFLFFRKNN
jgi:hypothetical protein